MNAALDRFYEVTGYNITAFFESASDFISTQYPLIIDFYNGGDYPANVFSQLNSLLKECEKIEPLFELKKNMLDNMDSWELLDVFSDVQAKLLTIANSSRWQRSSRLSVYSSTINVNQLLKTYQTFEGVANSFSLENPQDDWMDIAQKNEFLETDYSPTDSKGLFVMPINNAGNSQIDNVVDNLALVKQEDGSYLSLSMGKDINKKFSFKDGDVDTIQFQAALIQAFDTILKTQKGGIPEFPNYGLPNDMVGSTVNAMQYPIIFKAISNMFQYDSRFKEVQILDIYRKEDNIFMKIEARSVTNESLVNTIQL